MHALYILWESVFFGFFAALVAFFLSPLQYLKVVRQDTGRGYLCIISETLRGSSPAKVFFCAATPYAIMNFLANAAFGVGDYLSNWILGADYLFITGVIVRALLGGVVESFFTIYHQIIEIMRNKGSLAYHKAGAIRIAVPIFLRNSIVWLGSTFSYEVSTRFNIDITSSTLISFLAGVIFGIVSIPIDVVITQTCGGLDDLSAFQRFLRVIRSGRSMIFAGASIRILQISIFTVVTVLSMFLFSYLF